MKYQLTMAALALACTNAFAQTEPAQAPATDGATTLAKIKASGRAVMGVRDSSGLLSYSLGNGNYAGFHPDLCRQVLNNIAAKQGIKDLKIEYVSVTSQNRIPLMENGTIDIECGSTTNNKARQEQVAFALTTYVTEVRMAVNAKSGIKSIKDLNGKTVATTTGTTSVKLLRENEKSKGMDFKEVFGKDHADSFLLLDSGRADAFVMDDYILAGNIANAKRPGDFKIAGEVLSVEPIGIMMRKADASFKAAVDEQLLAMFKNGDYTKTYDRWFMQPIPPKNVAVKIPMPQSLKIIMKAPNDQPAEAYNKKPANPV